jgi:hypothetical protein
MPRLLVALSIVVALAGPARAADGPIRRFAVVAGASLGGGGRTPLRYAASDARDVARVLRRLGGVGLGDLVLVEEPDADALRRALGGVAAEAGRARDAGRRVELFVYYSGHSDEEGLLLGTTRLPYVELRRALDQVPADVRVAILDSCASGAITRAKGGVHRPPFLVDDANRVSGHAFLTSSAADEAAQESDRLRASFFTHALLTGLRGAADASGDGVVTLNEAYQFAFRETLAGTEASQAGPQHATYDIGLVGSGDVVMTDLRRADGILVIPEPVDGKVFVRNGAGALVAELRKARGARIELALEEGRYEVRVVREQRALGATVTLGGSARLVLDETQLWPMPLEATASRGDALAASPQPLPPAWGPAPVAPPLAAPSRAALRSRVLLVARGGVGVSNRRGSPVGADGEAGAAIQVGNVAALELSSGLVRFDTHTQGRVPTYFTLSYTGEVRDRVTVVPVRLTFQLSFPAEPIRAYLLAGGSLNWVRVDRYPDAAGAGTPPPAHLWDTRSYLGFHAGAGFAVPLTPRLSFTAEAKYVWGKPKLLQETYEMIFVAATAGVAYAF